MTTDPDSELNWSQQQSYESITPETMDATRQSYADAVAGYREEVLRESNTNGRRRLITSIRQTIRHCPFHDIISDLRAVCRDLEAQIAADEATADRSGPR
jgi:hypothetical protein